LGHELAVDTEGAKSVLDVEDDDVAWQSFKVPGYSGKVIVMVNTSVGSWCNGRSPHYLSFKDVFRIDDSGNAADYIPFKEPRKLKCRILKKETECIDLETGKPAALDSNQTLTLSIIPGGGRFLFLTAKGSDEWPRFKSQFKL